MKAKKRETAADKLERRNKAMKAAAIAAHAVTSRSIGDPLAAVERGLRLGAGAEWAHMRRDR